MLQSAVYCGYIKSNKLADSKMIKAKFNGLISSETYSRNQRILNSNHKVYTLNGEEALNDQYPLRGTLICPICGVPIRGTAPTNGSGKPPPPDTVATQKAMAHNLERTI